MLSSDIFEKLWAASGRQFGRDELDNVRLGWAMARAYMERGSGDRGPPTQTRSGVMFHAFDPTPDEVNLEDLGTPVQRWNGATGAYFTPQHAVHCAEYVRDHVGSPWEQYEALMHDAHEYGCMDLPGPWLRWDSPIGEMLREMERKVVAVVRPRCGIFGSLSPIVKRADHVLLVTEARDFLPNCPPEWKRPNEAPLSRRLSRWTAEHAEFEWWLYVRSLLEQIAPEQKAAATLAGDADPITWERVTALYEVLACARRMVARMSADVPTLRRTPGVS